MISKLPGLGTTIFTEMSALARECGALNLSQGFPEFSSDEQLFELVYQYMKDGQNQYAPMSGLPELKESIFASIKETYGVDLNGEMEICITAGATQAIFTAIQAFIHPGDEVIYIEPAYDSYVPSIRLCSGIPVPLVTRYPDFNIDWVEVENLIGSRTRMIVINNPGNPSGKVLDRRDLEELQRISSEHNLLVLSDEVYEHLVFDEQSHQSVLLFPELRKRSLAVYSFGKSLHNTGWKIGYIVAAESLMKEFLKVHQFNVFSVNSPMQYAIAEFIRKPGLFSGLSKLYSAKRDLFNALLNDSRFSLIPSKGTYFQLLSFEAISSKPEREFSKELTREQKVASIPLSVFYEGGLEQRVLRFCFAKNDETLIKAAGILCKI